MGSAMPLLVLFFAAFATARAEGEFLAAAKGQANTASRPSTQAARLEFVEQADAQIPVGGTVRLFVIGSSNCVWQTWIDQLHMLLNQLGYATPLVDPLGRPNVTRPLSEAICDNHEDHSALHTLRIGKQGWSSWGFAYESMEGCSEQGFRNITGHSVSCINGWQCEPGFTGSEALVRPSEIAAIAQLSEVTVLSNWQNDGTARFVGNLCHNGEVPALDDASLTIDSLLRTIRAIHALNPGVAVVVMARYPGAAGRVVGSDPRAMNAAVRAGIEGEPNTHFVDYDFPNGEDMFLTSRSGHPNCRGDKVMASSIVETLFRGRVLSRGLAMGDSEECLANAACHTLSESLGCCQRSALCWPSAEGLCVPYSPGQEPL